MNLDQIEARINQLADDLENDLDDVFRVACNEFGLDPDRYSNSLGCNCPYGLLGYLQAEFSDDED